MITDSVKGSSRAEEHAGESPPSTRVSFSGRISKVPATRERRHQLSLVRKTDIAAASIGEKRWPVTDAAISALRTAFASKQEKERATKSAKCEADEQNSINKRKSGQAEDAAPVSTSAQTEARKKQKKRKKGEK